MYAFITSISEPNDSKELLRAATLSKIERKPVALGLLIGEIENNEFILSTNIKVLLSYRSFNLSKAFW